MGNETPWKTQGLLEFEENLQNTWKKKFFSTNYHILLLL